MKLGPRSKLDKRNTATSKKLRYDTTSTNCDATVFFFNLWQIYSHPEAGFRTHGL